MPKSSTPDAIWEILRPDESSRRRPELYLRADAVWLFFDPVRCLGVLWRTAMGVGYVVAPVTAPEFVRAMVSRGVRFPCGPAMREWTLAITQGLLDSDTPEALLRVADEMEALERAHRPPGVKRH